MNFPYFTTTSIGVYLYLYVRSNYCASTLLFFFDSMIFTGPRNRITHFEFAFHSSRFEKQGAGEGRKACFALSVTV
jgi:hypothetical protein